MGAGSSVEELDEKSAASSLVGATVRAARVIWVNGEPRAASTASDTTDDRGQYRVFGLTPGTYYLSATGRSDGGAPLPGETDQGGGGGVSMPVGYAPTYYPAAVSVADATTVRVKAGQETLGIDVTTRLVSMAKVSGVVTSSEPCSATASRHWPAPSATTPDSRQQDVRWLSSHPIGRCGVSRCHATSEWRGPIGTAGSRSPRSLRAATTSKRSPT